MVAVTLLQENSRSSVIVERSLQFAEDAFRLLRSDGQQSLDVCKLVTAAKISWTIEGSDTASCKYAHDEIQILPKS